MSPNPKLPKTTTLEARALARLLHGSRLTPSSFQAECASMRLPHFIYELRQKNWPVFNVLREDKTSDPAGLSGVYAIYSIPKNELKNLSEQFGDRLDEFFRAVEKFEAGRGLRHHGSFEANQENPNLQMNFISEVL